MKIKDIIGIGISIIAIVVTITLFYINDPENISPTAVILSVTIISISFIGLIIIHIYSRWGRLSQRIGDNKKDIIEINRSLKLHELYNIMDKRLSILEKLIDNKKAQVGISPHIIYWIILLILLFLLFRSMNIF